MSKKVLEQVRKLIALASSPNEHEARTAAYKACKLIREHELELVEKKARKRPARRNTQRGATGPDPSQEPARRRKKRSTGFIGSMIFTMKCGKQAPVKWICMSTLQVLRAPVGSVKNHIPLVNV